MTMRYEISARGFCFMVHPRHDDRTAPPHEHVRVVSESSATAATGELPGSEFLWVGDHVHLDRVEVEELRDALTRWLETGSLEPGE